MSVVRWLFSRLFRHKILLSFVLFMNLLAIALELLLPLILGEVIDEVILNAQYQFLTILVVLILLIALLRGVSGFIQRYSGGYLGQKIIFHLRNELLESFQRQDFTFFDSESTGDLMSRATTDMDALSRFYSFGIRAFAVAAVYYIGIYFFFFLTSLEMTLLALIFVPILFIANFRFNKVISPTFFKTREKFGELNTILQESLSGVAVVKAFGAKEYEVDKFNETNQRYLGYLIHALRMRSFWMPLYLLIVEVFLGSTLLVGGWLVLTQQITLGTLGAFIFYVTYLPRPTRFLAFSIVLFSRSKASGERIIQMLHREPKIKDAINAIELPDSIQGQIKFENVSFQYANSDRPVLEHVSFTVNPGEIVAILGETGSGKSSVINLIPRFYDVTGGKILIDGIDIRCVTLQSLRSHIGVVHQETFLFSSSIAGNIAYGDPESPLDQIKDAAIIANAEEFINRFPEGFETKVGERGVTLSGGQKQRIAIARTLLYDPEIIILDDSTSSVDTDTELQIQDAIRELLQGRSTIMITQRLSTIKNANRILVFEDGRIVEDGTHSDLMTLNGIYKRLYETQFATQEVLEVV